MKTNPANEIAPDHWIEPPFYAKPGEPIPTEVRASNKRAAQQINANKDNFIRICLESLFTDEEIGDAMLLHLNQPSAYIPALIAKLDPSKLNLTLRDEFSPTLIIPSHHHPEDRRQKGHTRQTGHTLQMHYDNRWLGTMTIEYNDGRINIDITTRSENPAET